MQNVQEQNVDAQGNIKVHEQGTPSVKIVATANTVKVDASGGPLPTVATDNPAFHPVEAGAQFETPAGDIASAATVYTVPSGSELVIEQVSVTSDQTLAEVRFRQCRGLNQEERAVASYWRRKRPPTAASVTC